MYKFCIKKNFLFCIIPSDASSVGLGKLSHVEDGLWETIQSCGQHGSLSDYVCSIIVEQWPFLLYIKFKLLHLGLFN